MSFKAALFAACLSLSVTLPASPAAIVTGFDDYTLARNDDSSSGAVSIGFDVNFFGLTFSNLYVNNNGNITFDSHLAAFTPFDLTSTNRQIIAPFFADVDTTYDGNPVTYGQGSFNGMQAFGVNWIDVAYFSNIEVNVLNSFQLLLVDRSDIALGDFDIIFNYDKILWEAGTFSGGNSDGLGGSSARVGFSNGTGDAGSFFELSGSAVNGAFLDGGPQSLVANQLNSDQDGRYVFRARNGQVDTNPIPVPAPASLLLFAAGLILLRSKKSS